jgi:hypothetical protein
MDVWTSLGRNGGGIRMLFGLEKYLVSTLLFQRSSYSSGTVIVEANCK